MIALIKKLMTGFEGFADKLPSIADLAMRLVMARMFLKSGIVKVKDFEGAIDLFAYEYFDGMPYMLATVAAAMATIGETLLPVMLLVGFMTRYAAAGLLVMTVVISTAVYPFWTEDGLEYWWNDHAWWAVILLAILAYGAQRYSVDHWLKSRK